MPHESEMTSTLLSSIQLELGCVGAEHPSHMPVKLVPLHVYEAWGLLHPLPEQPYALYMLVGIPPPIASVYTI